MDKEKQIEEMAEIMCDDFGASFFAEKLYDAGYRKQSDTAREILQYLYKKMGNVSLSDTELVLYYAAQYGVEVEE